MATDNKQKVLIRSMSTEEIEKYLINSDLNDKIIPKNEDTWHQNYDNISGGNDCSSILSNETKINQFKIFINRKISLSSYGHEIYVYYSNYLFTKSNKIYFDLSGYYITTIINCFRPLIEYKE